MDETDRDSPEQFHYYFNRGCDYLVLGIRPYDVIAGALARPTYEEEVRRLVLGALGHSGKLSKESRGKGGLVRIFRVKITDNQTATGIMGVHRRLGEFDLSLLWTSRTAPRGGVSVILIKASWARAPSPDTATRTTGKGQRMRRLARKRGERHRLSPPPAHQKGPKTTSLHPEGTPNLPSPTPKTRHTS
jgi:hypothetical protein